MHVLWRGDYSAAAAARLRAHPLHVRRHALHQSRAGPHQHRHDAGRAAVALDGDALLAGHDRAARGAPHARFARALQARRPRDAAAAALGAGADPARDIDPVPAAAAHRQHAHRARLLQRERHLRLRAGAAVAGERHHPKPAARHRVGARLHGHPFLAAALPAVPARLPAAADAGRHHPAGGARRLRRRRQQRRRRDRGPVGARQSQGADALAGRDGGRDARMAAQSGAHRVRRGAGGGVGLHRLDVLRAPRRTRR